MARNFFSLLSLFLLFSSSIAVNAQRTCGTVEHMQQALHDDPAYAQRRQEIETQTQNYIAHPQANNERVVYTIPVVVHVVYNLSVQNISDAQIQSQITVMNADFRKLNSDASLTPNVFAGLSADAEIEFCLAQRDPNGSATNGITRTYTATTSFSGDGVKTSSQGHTPWDRNKYLNIWVCRLSGGTLGYTYLPGGSAATDGVVIDYRVFGTTGTATAPFNKGRTVTHEVGHWFNLEHIWGDDGSACSGTDYVSDTPNQADENYGCPNFPQVSCSNGPNGDMFMNYMDYTDDACMFMFTTGQKTRMRAVLASGGARYSLLSSNGCTPVSSNCGTPTNLSTTLITATSARFNWAAVSGATSYNIQGRKVGSATWTNLTTTTNYKQLGAVLQACKQYEWKVQAVCSNGTSAYSSAVTFSSTCANEAPAINSTDNSLISNRESFDAPTLQLSPNPASNMVSLVFESAVSANATIRIYDVSGRVALAIPAYTDLGANQQQIDLGELTTGYYFVEIDNGTQKLREKLMIVR